MVRAPACHAGGCEFKPRLSRDKTLSKERVFRLFPIPITLHIPTKQSVRAPHIDMQPRARSNHTRAPQIISNIQVLQIQKTRAYGAGFKFELLPRGYLFFLFFLPFLSALAGFSSSFGSSTFGAGFFSPPRRSFILKVTLISAVSTFE